MVIESAQTRILRILIVSVGFGSIVFTLLGLAGILGQHKWLNPAFSSAVYVIYLGIPLVLAALAFRLPERALRAGLLVHAASALVAVGLWYFMLKPGVVPNPDQPWIMNTIAVATCTAALALGFVPSIVYVIVIAAASAFLRFAIGGGVDASAAFQDFVLITLFSTVLAVLLQFSLRAGRLQDAASSAAQADAAKTGAAETFERNRARYQDFTQNEVLATFAATLRDGSYTQPATRESARLVLAKMDELQTDHVTPSFLPAAEFISLLKSSSHDAVPLGVAISDQRVMVPVDVADVLAAATGAAIRNSVRHAPWKNGKPVLRRALVKVGPGGIEIVLSDDGRGFAVSRIAPDRMGVRVTILQAVNALPGGYAEVESSRGHGTTVTLRWKAAQ
jgi:hypothetical protein